MKYYLENFFDYFVHLIHLIQFQRGETVKDSMKLFISKDFAIRTSFFVHSNGQRISRMLSIVEELSW